MGYCVPRIWERLRHLGRVFLTYFLIYQQVYMGVVWANGGLRVIQADLHETQHHRGSSLPQDSQRPTISFSRESVKLREEFSSCDWVFRKDQDKAQALYRWQGKFYEVRHPELLQSVQMLKRGKDQDISSLYIKSLLEGFGEKNLVVGLESDGKIIIEDGIQVKGFVTYAPRVVTRAMAPLDSQGKVNGIDVEHLEVHGGFKIKGDSTLNVHTLHLHEGTLINQGVLKFKAGGTAHLHGNDLINNHKIKGRKSLTFYDGGSLDHRTSRSQLKVSSGKLIYEGKEMVSHPAAFIEAQKIAVKTSQGLRSLPCLQGDQLQLEAASFEGCDLKGVTSFKKLKLISTKSSLTFSDPLALTGSLKAEAPEIKNTRGIQGPGQIHLKAPSIVNEAFLFSAQEKVLLQGNVQHTRGILRARKGVEIEGETHTLTGDLHPQTAFTIKSRQGFTYDSEKLKTENLLKLVFQEGTFLHQEVKTLGVLEIEGPSFTITSSVQAHHLEARTPFLKIEQTSLLPSLKAWGEVEIESSAFTAEDDLDVEGDLKITASGPVALKGTVLSKQDIAITGTKVSAEQEVFAHKKLSLTSHGDILFKERAVGRERMTLITGGELHYKDGGKEVTPETSGLQTLGFLDITSTHPHLVFIRSLHLLGFLRINAPLVYNYASLKSEGGLEITVPLYPDKWSILNLGELLSFQGDILLKGRVFHPPGGHIGAKGKLVIEGTIHDLSSSLTGGELIEVLSHKIQDLTYKTEVFHTQGLLRLLFKEGGILSRPLEVAGGLEISLLPHASSQVLEIQANLKAGKGMRVKAPGHWIRVGAISLPFVELQSGDVFEVSSAKIFDLIHGGIFSDAFFHIKAEESITLGRLREAGSKTYFPICGYANGPSITVSHPSYVTNGSYFVSNKGMRLETKDYASYGGQLFVMDKDLEMIIKGYCYPISDLIEVWNGNAYIESSEFKQHMYTVVRCGTDICSPYWISYGLPGGAQPKLRVNGNLFFKVQKGESWGGLILASGTIFGEELIHPRAYSFWLESAVQNSSSKVPYNLLYMARYIVMRGHGWSNENIQWKRDHEGLDLYFAGVPYLNKQTHVNYSFGAQLEGCQGIAFTKTKQALVQGRVIGEKIFIGFEKDLTVQTVGRPGLVVPYQPIMDVTSLCQLSSLVRVDMTGKSSSLIVPIVPIKYPLEEELQGMKRLILGPQGSQNLPFILPSFLEGRALLEAFQQNIGYVPLTAECPDYLSLHRKVIQNGAELIPYIRPLLEDPKCLGLLEGASSQALLERGTSLLQGLKPSLPHEIALKLNQPLLFYGPQQHFNQWGLGCYLYTPSSYDDPKKREQIAQMWAKKLCLLGKPKSHLHLDKSRLVAEQGQIVTGTLSLEKEIKYDAQKQEYSEEPGGEIAGDTWAIHAENVINKLGSIDAKHLWLDVLNHYYTSGVTKADVLVLDVKHVTLDREQRVWTVTYTVETTTKKRNRFGGSKERRHQESHTVTLTESYPVHLSGLLAFKKFIGAHEDATAWFPERQEGREIESFNVYAATIRSENEGWAPHVKEIIKFHPKVDTSLRYSETRCKGYFKRGMIPESKVVSPQLISKGPLHPVCEEVIDLVSLQITTSSPHVVFEADKLIHLQEQRVLQQEDFQYFKRGDKVYERSGWHEERTPIIISMPGRPVFRGRGEIQGEVTEIQGCEKPVYEAPIINVTRPVLQQESHERVIGQISRSYEGFAQLAALAVGIASMGTATPAVMAAFLGEIGGTIASAMVASIASQTASSVVLHKGHIKQVGKDLTSSDFARSLIVTAATAGVMHEVGKTLKLPMQPKGFEQHLKVNAVRSAVSSSLNMTIGGCKPKEAIFCSLKSFAANTAGGIIANNLGALQERGDLSYGLHKGGHFVTGFLLGLGLSEGDIQAAFAGGTGAAMAEVFAEAFHEDPTKTGLRVLKQAKEEGRSLTQEEYWGSFQDELQKSQNIGKIGAALTALITGQDVGTAIFTASNAVENNFIVAAIPYVVGAGLTAWGAYDVYETYRVEGPEAALKKVGVEAVSLVVGGAVIKTGFKIAGKLYPTAELAWSAYLSQSPRMATMAKSFSSAVSKVKGTIVTSKAGKAVAKLDVAGDELVQKGVNKVKGIFGKSTKNTLGEIGLQKGDILRVNSEALEQLHYAKDFKYDMVNNPGPLSISKSMEKMSPASNFAGGKYNMVAFEEDIILFRAGHSRAKPFGEWFSRKPPESIPKVRIDTAVKPHWVDPKTGLYDGSSPIDCYYQIKVPKGTTVYIGPVANQGSIHVGGSSIHQIQIHIPFGTSELELIGKEMLLK